MNMAPTIGISEITIPVIDLSKSKQESAHALVSAAASSGFVFIKSVDLDFDADIINQIFKVVSQRHIIRSLSYRANLVSQVYQFFHSPVEERASCTMEPDVTSDLILNEPYTVLD